MSSFIKRHLLSLTALLFTMFTFVGWYSSVKSMESYNMETPFGIFQFQSESSMFQAGAVFMQHEHRWAFWKNSDPAWGDKMRLVAKAPKFQAQGGKFSVFAPYWQLFFALILLAGGLFWLEQRRIKRRKAEFEIPSDAPAQTDQ